MSRYGVLSRPRAVLARLSIIGLVLVLGFTLPYVLPAPPASAAPCDAPVVNEIACENTKAGTPRSQWDITGSGSASIQGFATDISVNRGSPIGFKVKTTSTTYRLDIYRMGYYGGAGARLVATVTPTTFLNQPACLSQASTGLVDCGNWTQTASWAVPASAVSGIYFAKVVASTAANAAASHIVFIVRDDASTSDVLFQTSDTTWQAYNDYGGNSLYEGSPAGRAYKVSYNRPFDTAAETAEDFVWNAEYPTVRFLEANGYDVSYTSGIDTERRGNLLPNHKTFLSVGHDEYWSGPQRTAVEAARSAGVNLAFLSGNEVFWKTRWENSIAAGAAGYRTLVSYKETSANAKIDPAGAGTWTGTWRDPRFSPPGDGGRPENALTGTIFAVNCCTTDMKVDGTDGQMRFWRNTRVPALGATQTTVLGSGILGYEWDESPDNGYRPAGLVQLSTTSENVPSYLQDQGSSYAAGAATHHLVMYRAPSGALVFGAGSVQWAWGLDDDHAGGAAATSDAAVRQATVNLLADMATQPATLQPGLVAATASTDTTAPTSTISSPAAGATVPVGQPLTISGTATDTGGRVGGVEVSTDDGVSWHPAEGRGTWSYAVTPTSDSSLTIRSRAADDSGRIETPAAGRTVTVGSGPTPPGTCPCSLWPATATPAVAADPDASPIEIGVKFRAAQAGFVNGIRFYKGTGNAGTHVGSLWSEAGTKLGSATFTSESATGWQQVLFAAPVAVSANTTYVASYFAPSGRYAATDGYFATARANGPLTALQDTAAGANGVYKLAPSGFPTQGFSSSNYWVDVVFTPGSGAGDTTKPSLTDRQPADGATGVGTSTAVTATFSEPVTADSVRVELRTSTNVLVPGSTSYDPATRRGTFTPTSALDTSAGYTATVLGATDSAGNVMDTASWTFTTAAAAPIDTTPPTVTSRSPASGATNVSAATTVTATFSEAVQPATVVFSLVNGSTPVTGSTAYDAASRTVTFAPGSALAASTSYTAKVAGAKDAAGNAMLDVSWSFTTAAPPTSGCPCTLWPATTVPAVAADPDATAVELGVKFRTSQSGFVSGLRFYKGPGNTGSHVGSLWSRTGTRLASAAFTGETASGWQQVLFASPVAVAANTTYVASYHAPAGRYSVNESYFTAATTRGPLTALSSGTDGVNGVYRYGASGFPSTAFRASNYWVDVVFTSG
jgi:methionine-rich copper-binding protein CopC